MSYKVEPMPDSYAELGEGPHWDIERQCLYFVDLPVGKILRYDYRQNKVYRAQVEGERYASFIIPIEGQANQFAVGCSRRVVCVEWDGIATTARVVRTLFSVQQDEAFKKNRFNDGKCDKQGRLFAGTMYEDNWDFRTGEFYKFERSGETTVLKSDIGISNGLTWNYETKKFYYVDSLDYNVKEYDYDVAKGVASNPRVIYDLRKIRPDNPFFPDGMTIDTKGCLYIATFNGHCVEKFDPVTKKLLLTIDMPCKQITSVAFGGPNLDILFVTTSAVNKEPAPAGTTYMITGLGAKGLPMHKMVV